MKSTAHTTFGIAGQPITAPFQHPLDAPVMARNGFTPQYGGASGNTIGNGSNSPKTSNGAGSDNSAPKLPSENKTAKQTQAKPKQQNAQQPAHTPQSGNQRPQNGMNPQLQAVLGFLATYKREIAGIGLAVFGVILLLALVSYSPEDRANARVSLANQAAQANAQAAETAARATAGRGASPASAPMLNQDEYIIKNWLGYVGASVSHFVYNYTVGYAALAFPIMMFLWSGAILRRSYSDKLLLGTALALVGTAIFASFAGVLQLVPWMPTMRPEWSGSVGQFIARMLWQVIGTVGAFIALTAALVATLFTALDLNIEKTIARFNDEKSRFGAWKSKSTSDFAQSVRESMNDAPAASSVAGASVFTDTEDDSEDISDSFSDSFSEASNTAVFTDEVLSNEVIADDAISKAMFGTVTEAPKAVSYIMDDEVLSAKAEKATPKPTPTLADADEPARILQRSAENEQPLASIRRDLITKYTDNAPEAASEVLSAQSLQTQPKPQLPQNRVNAGSPSSPTISVSTSQTTIHAPSFAYPSQASITFVEKKNDKGEIKAEGKGIKDKAEEPHTAQNLDNQALTNQALANQALSNQVTTEDLMAERRNLQHLTGLMAEQVAGEVAEKVANEVAHDVAFDVAERIAKQVAADLTEQLTAQLTGNLTANVSEIVLQQMREQMQQEMTERVEEQVSKRLAEEAALQAVMQAAEAEKNVTHVAQRTQQNAELRMNIRTAGSSSNSLDVIAKPLFMPHNTLNEEIDYTPPHLGLLVPQEPSSTVDEAELQEKARILQAKLSTFKIEIENLNVTPGPVVTQYEFVPAAGVKVAQIENLADDIALALKARGIRIIAPVPGRGTVAVEIPNHKATAVRFSSIVDTAEFQDAAQRLPLALGKTIHGDVYAADLAKMPHLLIAGATGSGKSVGINSIIASLLYKMHPHDLKFVIIDPKKVEMSQYRSLANHFLAVCPDIDEKIITNPQNAVLALKSVVAEMERRYDVLAKVGQRNIVDYNQKVRDGRYKDTSEVVHSELPYIVVIVDELADLMMTASRDVEEPICRLAQLARAVGIHLIVATQRPSVDVVTGLIKANFPARIAYQVSSKIDSRTILDTNGAEHLLGNGDMLFTPGGAGKPMRLQNSYLSTDEVERICDHISQQQGYSQPYFLPSVSEKTQKNSSGGSDDSRDELFQEAARFVIQHQQCSTSFLQRRMKIGYSRAARIADQLEEAGIVGGFDGSKGRAVLVSSEAELEGIL